MVFSSHECPGVAGKVCNRFLPAQDKDPHTICNYRGKSYSTNDYCSDCHDWTDKLWEKVLIVKS